MTPFMIVRKERKILLRKKIEVINPVLKNKVHYMTSDYKSRNSSRSTHGGIDMIGKNYSSDYIIAIADGIVSEVGYSKTGSGYYVKIKHDQYESWYCHMKKGSITVKKNQNIKKGNTIGYMGSTGNATGVHLHFAIKYNNEFIDPLPYLDGTKSFNNYYYVYNCENLNIRTGPSTKYKIINTIPCNTKVNVLETKNNFCKISNNSYISKNYLTKTKPQKSYPSKIVNTANLNVRIGPSIKYNTASNYSPLPKYTVVSIITSGSWCKISLNENRYVSSNYLL